MARLLRARGRKNPLCGRGGTAKTAAGQANRHEEPHSAQSPHRRTGCRWGYSGSRVEKPERYSSTDACYRSGFHSYSAFTRAYSKHFGTTPTGRKDPTIVMSPSYE